ATRKTAGAAVSSERTGISPSEKAKATSQRIRGRERRTAGACMGAIAPLRAFPVIRRSCMGALTLDCRGMDTVRSSDWHPRRSHRGFIDPSYERDTMLSAPAVSVPAHEPHQLASTLATNLEEACSALPAS